MIENVHTFTPKDFTERENYKLMIGSIIPRPITFVTSKSMNSILNAAPFSYFNIVTPNPPMISISIQRKNGISKDTVKNIVERQEFVVHIVDEEIVEGVNQTAASLTRDENELELTNFTIAESVDIGVPGIKEAKVRFECRLENVIALGGDESNPGTDLVIGNIIRYHINKDIYEDGKIDPKALGAISRLAGNNYSKLGTIFTIERPK